MSAKKYFKFDEIDQFLEDQTDINYYATNQVRRVAVGNMLGDYNEQGLYVLDEKLIKELVAMPKVIVDSVGGADLIRSAIKFDSYIHFMLTIEEDKASLILLEKVNFESNVKYNAGLVEDGSFGSKTKVKCKNANATKELSYICQAMLYCKGYDMSHSIENNNLDASYGKGTKATVLDYQQDTRGLRHDGVCGSATFYAMFNS